MNMDKDDTNISNSDAKKLTCDVCDKTFTTKYNLNVHERIHSGVKPYQCDICSKPYTLKHHVTHHMLVHSGKKEFQCRVCGNLVMLHSFM